MHVTRIGVILFEPPRLFYDRERVGFERVPFVRSAQKPEPAPQGSLFVRTAHWMLSTLRFMVPSEQPVRAARVAELVATVLQMAPLTSTWPRPTWCGGLPRATCGRW